MNQPKTARKILLILADSITGDIVLNKLFNTRSVILIYIMIRKRSIADAALQTWVWIDNLLILWLIKDQSVDVALQA